LRRFQFGAEIFRFFFRCSFESAQNVMDLRAKFVHLVFKVLAIPLLVSHERRITDMDSLSPETRRQIERQLDAAADRTGVLANAIFHYLKHALWILPVLLVIAFAVDDVALRVSASPTGTVTIKRYYAVGLKNGK